MSLVLAPPRPLPTRPFALLVLTVALTLASALGLAPTLARTAGAPAHGAVCTCVHCPGGARCRCRTKGVCPIP